MIDNGFHFFLCESKNPIDLSYTKLFKTKEVLLVDIQGTQVSEYKYPRQKKMLINMLEKASLP